MITLSLCTTAEVSTGKWLAPSFTETLLFSSIWWHWGNIITQLALEETSLQKQWEKKEKKKETKVKKTVWLWQGFQWFLQFSSGAPEPGLSATWVAHLLLASLLLYCRWLRALVSIIAHILTANVDFVLCRKSRGSSKHCCGPTSAFLWRVQVCPSRPSVSPAATPPYLSHKTQQEERTRLETTTWPPPPPPLLPSSPSQHLSSLICIALALNLIIFSVNKPGSGRNYTQLGVRSFSRKGPGSFYLKCFLFLLL